MRTQYSHFLRDLIVISDHHSALTSGHIFVPKKAVATHVAPGAKRFAIQAGSHRVSGIFDHRQPTLFGYAHNFGHVAGKAGIMHDHDRLGLFRYSLFDRSRADTKPVFAFNICEYHLGSGVADGIGCCDKGQ